MLPNMKYFAPLITISSLLFCLFSCDTGKSGPFTFTNNTGETVNVLIDQDGILEKTFAAGEKYIGKDYYTPQITFVKGLDSADNKKIIDNRYTYTTTNGFDYEFRPATSTTINISASLPDNFATTYPDYGKWYLSEVNGKLGEFSNTTVKLSEIQSPASNYKLYTSNPQFRIYNDSNQDVTNLFTISLGKETEPTPQWNLVISYPKVELVE